jgi:nitric oxide reductase activation protein
VEISIGAMAEGDLSSAVTLFMMNLRRSRYPIPEQQPGQRWSACREVVTPEDLSAEPEILYDEWDFRAADYKPRWCRVLQRPLDEGDQEYYEETLRRYSGLAAKTRRQFEQLRPELFRRIKRLHDGEDVDLDLVIEYATEKRAGHSFTDKVYWRRNKVERQVAVAFLLDMSASTDEEIEKRKQKYQEDDRGDDPRRYYEWLARRKAEAMLEPPKRIIDLEKESVVLLIAALEAIGDDYGIYGFSGYGRDNVEFYVLKDLKSALRPGEGAHRQDVTDTFHPHGPGDPPRHGKA